MSGVRWRRGSRESGPISRIEYAGIAGDPLALTACVTSPRSRCLLVDRVLREPDGRAIDLVSGADVLLRVSAVGAADEHRAWAEACAQRYTIRHPGMAMLRDFGVTGSNARFEVFDDPRARAADRHISRASCRADVSAPSSALVVSRSALRRAHYIQPRCAVARVVSWMAERDASPIRELYVCGPAGSGLSTTSELIAREGRLSGFVPVGASLLPSLTMEGREEVIQMLSTRHLLILRDLTRTDYRGFSWLDRLARVAQRPILIITIARAAPRDLLSVPLDPLDSDALMRTIGAVAMSTADRRRARGCADRSDGWPGRFLDAWHRTRVVRYTINRARLPRAAERAAKYGETIARGGCAEETAIAAATQTVIDRALKLAASGRHAAARLALKECAAQLERRSATQTLARVRLALGELARARGSLTEAIRELDRARAAVGDELASDLRIAILTAMCRTLIDLGDLRRSESIARTIDAAARYEDVAAPGSLHVLATALYWQGHYEEAVHVLHGARADDGAALALKARNALARGELADAAVLAQAAIENTSPERDPEARLAAITSAALIAGGTADQTRIHSLVVEGSSLARTSHCPMWMIEVRLSRVEALIRARDIAGARAAARGLRRFAERRALRLASARARTLMAVLESASPEACEHDGIQALVDLHAALAPSSARSARRRIRDDLAELLELTQEAPDERTALSRMATFVARTLPHATISLFAREDRAVTLVTASDTGAPAVVPDVAHRTLAAGVPIGPARGRDGVDFALPVRFAGSIIGALSCRWSVEGPLDWTRIELLLATAASAAGPCLRAVVDHGARRSQAAAVELIGNSSAMQALREQIVKAGCAPFAVLIEGESGAGKELVARAIHRASARRDRKWCAINCAALGDELLEAELFGHSRGAFTGAVAERVGLFEDADGGTLFLDEVGELSARAQAKLLRALQDGEVRRVGENMTRRVDVRVIAATNRRLADEVAAGRFREDLWYRLAIVRIAVPPLRARPEDVPELVKEFWCRAAERTGSKAVLTAAAVAALARYDWPGNVREVQNVMAALSVSAPRRGPITLAHLPDALVRTAAEPASLEDARRTFERRFVRAAMARAGGRISAAARELGISRQGLAKLLTRLESVDAPAVDCAREPRDP